MVEVKQKSHTNDRNTSHWLHIKQIVHSYWDSPVKTIRARDDKEKAEARGKKDEKDFILSI